MWEVLVITIIEGERMGEKNKEKPDYREIMRGAFDRTKGALINTRDAVVEKLVKNKADCIIR